MKTHFGVGLVLLSALIVVAPPADAEGECDDVPDNAKAGCAMVMQAVHTIEEQCAPNGAVNATCIANIGLPVWADVKQGYDSMPFTCDSARGICEYKEGVSSTFSSFHVYVCVTDGTQLLPGNCGAIGPV